MRNLEEDTKKRIWEMYKIGEKNPMDYSEFRQKIGKKGENSLNMKCKILYRIIKQSE